MIFLPQPKAGVKLSKCHKYYDFSPESDDKY